MDRIERRVVVPSTLAGKRLDQAAAVLLHEFSRSRLRTWIDAGKLTVGGAVSAARTRVHGGEELRLDAELGEAEQAYVLQGQPVFASGPADARVRMYGPGHVFLGVGQMTPEGRRVQPVRIMLEAACRG